MHAELKSGSMLGRYELLTRLGRGGMASVWVARERAPSGKQRLVAVKAMLPELARQTDFRAMFLEEGQIVRSIDHPHVVKVHEVSEDRGVLYMAMEWVEGDSLRTVIKEAKRRRAIPAEMAVKIIADTAAGLHAAHELRGWDGELRNIVHCDVSPHNILVGLDGQAKLVDFGVANAAAHSDIGAEDRIKGKFGYMSPEQAAALKIDRRSDVFALGIVLFELTTGERLFRGENSAHTLELVKRGKIPLPTEIHAKYSPGLERIVMRALDRDISRRFQTAAEFQEALERYLKEERILVPPAGVGQLVRRVLGQRIELQRQSLREALTAADGTLQGGLIPDQSAAPDRSHPSYSGSGQFSSPLSDPPSSSSHFSHSRSGTPSAHALPPRPHKAGFAPLFAALGGLLAAGTALFWATHRPPPTPLLTTQLPGATAAAAPSVAGAAAPGNDPSGVSVDSLATAGVNAPGTPPRAAAPAAGRKGSRPERVSLKDDPTPPKPDPVEPEKVELAADPPPAPKAPEPVDKPLPPPDQRAPLNRGAAVAALGSAASAAGSCKRPDGPSGSGTATVTFSPDGPVSSVRLSAPFAGTAVGNCVIGVFRNAHVAPFSGSSITLPKGFTVPD